MPPWPINVMLRTEPRVCTCYVSSLPAKLYHNPYYIHCNWEILNHKKKKMSMSLSLSKQCIGKILGELIFLCNCYSTWYSYFPKYSSQFIPLLCFISNNLLKVALALELHSLILGYLLRNLNKCLTSFLFSVAYPGVINHPRFYTTDKTTSCHTQILKINPPVKDREGRIHTQK